jgi:hypothetical protein
MGGRSNGAQKGRTEGCSDATARQNRNRSAWERAKIKSDRDEQDKQDVCFCLIMFILCIPAKECLIAARIPKYHCVMTRNEQ